MIPPPVNGRCALGPVWCWDRVLRAEVAGSAKPILL